MPKSLPWLSRLAWTEFLAPWFFPISLDGTREHKRWDPRRLLLLVGSPVAVLWALAPNNSATWWTRFLTALAGVVGMTVLMLAFVGYRRLAAPPTAPNDSEEHSSS
ncbi:hypothetical protein [Streptomyces morookaense]|uniref:Uncharacterized protein n=1 Tax=Streptomyces morookaense TaxID=1970 RepID=A0A7Y7B757_STRMO|nr:hypothetical protein [Streptomyces morookaense]NVK80079.1 hypothetical protein [Streptomyces morookaense]GHF46201.1 hypothetical protein GCM10010359_55840 [Streptomyces morookaense]